MDKRRSKVRMRLARADWNDSYLMGWFHGHAMQQGWAPADIEAVLAEARSGDHEHLVSTLMEHIEEPALEPTNAVDRQNAVDSAMEGSQNECAEQKNQFAEGQAIFVVTGTNDMMDSICLYAFDSREAAELWANDDSLNDRDRWVINEMPIRSLIGNVNLSKGGLSAAAI